MRYLRYVILHKLYVLAGGIAVYASHRRNNTTTGRFPSATRWLWRLLVHDWSKFRPSEWRPYAAYFYGETPEAIVERRAAKWRRISEESHGPMSPAAEAGHLSAVRGELADLIRERQAAFNRAWLLHIHRNPHHWQHWILHEDSGKTLVLLPEAVVADEMLADWIGAGTKILKRPTLAECIAETITWYGKNCNVMQLRQPVRQRIEATLLALSHHYGVTAMADEIRSAKAARASIELPGREPWTL